MKKVLMVIVGAGIVVIIALAIRGNMSAGKDATRTPQPAAALLAQTTETPSPVPTATEMPLPTVDYSSVYPVQTQAEAARINADAMQARANAVSTLLAATPTALAMAMQFGTPTAIAMQTAQAIGTQSAQATSDANQKQALYIRAQHDDEVKRQNELSGIAIHQTLIIAVIVICALIVGGIILLIIRGIDRRQWSNMMENAPEINVLSNLSAPAAPSFISVAEGVSHPANVPVSDKIFRAWAEKMLAGETAGINKWETADSPFGRVGYKDFLAWAERMGYIDDTGKGKMLSDKGRNFCAAWLARRQVHPPLTVQTPESA